MSVQVEVMETLEADEARWMGWRAALVWGIGAALVHRVALGVWMAAAWTFINQWIPDTIRFAPASGLPLLDTPAKEMLFGVWRRWDAVHYLTLATYGYRTSDPGESVFGPLAPLGIRLFDVLLPGEVDLAAIVFETVAFALALVLLYRVCEVYYRDAALGRWAVVVVAIAPLSYQFAAPLSESIFLAMTLGLFYFGATRRWAVAAIFGMLATLARWQGLLLLGVGGLLLLEYEPSLAWIKESVIRGWQGLFPPKIGDAKHGDAIVETERTITLERLMTLLARGAVLLLIPLGALGFAAYRTSIGLPSLSDVYRDYSYNYLTNPIDGLLINIRYMVAHPHLFLKTPDFAAVILGFGLAIVMLWYPKHRRLPLVAYTFGSLLLYISRINYQWGTQEVTSTQSFSRYTIVLFPIAVLVADGLRSGKPYVRLLGIGILVLSLMAFSALSTVGLIGP